MPTLSEILAAQQARDLGREIQIPRDEPPPPPPQLPPGVSRGIAVRNPITGNSTVVPIPSSIPQAEDWAKRGANAALGMAGLPTIGGGPAVPMRGALEHQAQVRRENAEPPPPPAPTEGEGVFRPDAEDDPAPRQQGGGGWYIPPQYGYTPEGRTSQTQTQQGVKLSQEAQQRISDAEKSQTEALSKSTAAEQSVAREEARQKGRYADVAKGYANAEEMQQGGHHTVLGIRQQLLDQERKDLEDLHEDPSRYWNSKGAFQKVAGFVGAALGGFLQGYRGGENPFMVQLNKEIDRDIAAQREEIQNKRANYGEAVNAYERLRQQYGSDEAATAALHLKHLQAAQLTMDAAITGSKSPVLAARGAQANADLQQRMAEQRMKLEEAQADKTTTVTHQAERFGVLPGTGIGGGGGPAGPSEREMMAHEWELIKSGKSPAQARQMTEAWANHGRGAGAGMTAGGHGADPTARLDAIDSMRDATERLRRARQNPLNAGEMHAAEANYKQASMVYMQNVHGVRATVAHMEPIERSMPGPFTPGGDAALRRREAELQQERRTTERRAGGGGGEAPEMPPMAPPAAGGAADEEDAEP